MFQLEAEVNQMFPLIDNELELVDRHHAKLTQLSTSLVEAINMYHLLMRESDLQSSNLNIYKPQFQITPYHLQYGATELQIGLYILSKVSSFRIYSHSNSVFLFSNLNFIMITHKYDYGYFQKNIQNQKCLFGF